MDCEKQSALVTVNDAALPTFQKVKYYHGKFWWGYHGAGAAQLSLAILCDLYGTESPEKDLHQQFKRLVIAKLPHGNWAMSEDEVRVRMDEILKRREDNERSTKHDGEASNG